MTENPSRSYSDRAGLDSKTKLNIIASNPRDLAWDKECSTRALPMPCPRMWETTK